MQIKIPPCPSMPVGLMFTVDVDRIEINGVDYPPIERTRLQPPRWKCLVQFGAHRGGTTWANEDVGGPAFGDHDPKARAEMGFDDNGRVWFESARAKELASWLRSMADTEDTTQFARQCREAADMLAGPQQ